MKNTQGTFLDKLSGWFPGDGVKKTRWLKAQEYERRHWERIAHDIVSGSLRQLDWYEWKAREFEKRISKFVDLNSIQKCKILEIGSGPIGIVSSLKWGDKYAIDPLEDFFKENEELVRLRNNHVTYQNGQAENLTFEDREFSLVIIDNVIDHTQSPIKVLREIERVLKSNGLVFLTVNIHTNWGMVIRTVLEIFQLDKGHPHTFTYRSIRELLREARFRICYEELEDYDEVKKKNAKARTRKDKLKEYLGIYEVLYTSICKKEG